MRTPVLLFLLLAGCAAAPTIIRPIEYEAPLVRYDDSVVQLPFDTTPGSRERVMFCVEFDDGTLCVIGNGETATRVFYPTGDLLDDGT